ncbi:MAG: membrane protein insertase YidC, partial [Paracoccaceae bacterium]
MDDQNKNLILATVLSFLVILTWFILFPPPEAELPLETTETAQATNAGDPTIPAATAVDGTAPLNPTALAPSTAIANAPRIAIETDRLTGSVSLIGGRIDDLKLKDYRTTNDDDAPIVTLLSPQGDIDAYYALQGWAGAAGLAPSAVPGPDTAWTLVQGDTLSTDTPVTLRWDNGAGLVFTRSMSVDDGYMFNMTQSVTNTGNSTVNLAPFSMVVQHTEPDDLENFFILHEGAVAMADDELSENDWDAIAEADVNAKWGRQAIVSEDITAGWIGFTDHFWQAILIPQSDMPY